MREQARGIQDGIEMLNRIVTPAQRCLSVLELPAGAGRAEDRKEFEIGEWLCWSLENRSENLSGTHPCGQPQSNSSHLLRIVMQHVFFQWQTSSWAVLICGMSPNTLDRQPFHFSRGQTMTTMTTNGHVEFRHSRFFLNVSEVGSQLSPTQMELVFWFRGFKSLWNRAQSKARIIPHLPYGQKYFSCSSNKKVRRFWKLCFWKSGISLVNHYSGWQLRAHIHSHSKKNLLYCDVRANLHNHVV